VTYPVTDVECSYDDVALRNAPTLQLLLMVKEQNETDQRAAYECVCMCVETQEVACCGFQPQQEAEILM